MNLFTSDRRVYVTADRSRVVPETNPDAAYLLVAEGGTLPMDEAERYGLTGSSDPPAEPEKPEPPAPPEKVQAIIPPKPKRR